MVTMPPVPVLILFDVNETLSDMSPMRDRWQDVGAPSHLADLWFADVLRDGFALAAAGRAERFAMLAEQAARRLLGSAGVRDVDAAVSQIMAGFGDLQVHPDVPDGVRALGDVGIRLATLSNGAAAVADELLTRAGLRDAFEQVLSVEGATRWKPTTEAYLWALERCGVPPHQAMLVAVHPWDIEGAARSGLRTAWVRRAREEFGEVFTAPEITASSLVDLARKLADGR